MSSTNLKTTLESYNLKQSEFAALLDVSPRTVSLWASGEKPLPGPVEGYLRVLALLSPHTRAREFERLKGRNNMLDDGIYSLDYRGDADGETTTGDALAVLKSGRIRGADRLGGTFSGSYVFDEDKQSNTLHVRLQIPAGGVLVNGIEAGPDGTTLDIVGHFDRAAPLSRSAVDIAGRPVDITLTYLGPLPY